MKPGWRLFHQLARPLPSQELTWSPPATHIDLGGKLAVWVEKGTQELESEQLPWIAFHGGPGGSMSAAHIAPLRRAGVPWLAFDQRNSGLSEDLDLEHIDTQRFVDDATDLLGHFEIDKFNILGGSWGATLAMLMAAQMPDRVRRLVVRAPFIPLRIRVDAFFASLEAIDRTVYVSTFGQNARTLDVCRQVLLTEPEIQYRSALVWNWLENRLLGSQASFKSFSDQIDKSVGGLGLLRKYRLQAHFLAHDCFTSAADLDDLVNGLAESEVDVSIVQGDSDRVCPVGGARFLSEILPDCHYVELPGVGHLAHSEPMIQALAEQVARN